jgi:Co/Zn/Cd efflux system component
VSHPHVRHPWSLLRRERTLLGKLNDWATRNLALALGSAMGMWAAFVVPLVALGVPWLLKILGLVSSYWIQLWALFVLQRSANIADAKRDAKADSDHFALSHIANTVDAITVAQPGRAQISQLIEQVSDLTTVVRERLADPKPRRRTPPGVQ